MFELFQNKPSAPSDVKTIRQELLLFIKDQLKGIDSGEGGGLKSIQLYFAPPNETRHLYESAAYYDNPDRFKAEVQKIADDYAIDFPEEWSLELLFEDTIPEKCIVAEHMPVGLYISTKKQLLSRSRTKAVISVLRGEAEKASYSITAGDKKVCIGRERNATTSDGFMRLNTIAFPSEKAETNKYISRQHAHIEWNGKEGAFFLFADEGGIPPRNKVKVLTGAGEQLRLQATAIGHKLEDGDQIVLGDGALLMFNYDLNE